MWEQNRPLNILVQCKDSVNKSVLQPTERPGLHRESHHVYITVNSKTSCIEDTMVSSLFQRITARRQAQARRGEAGEEPILLIFYKCETIIAFAVETCAQIFSGFVRAV